jgi:hypothetical protein
MMGTEIIPPLLRSDFAQSTARSTPNGDLTDSSSPETEGLLDSREVVHMHTWKEISSREPSAVTDRWLGHRVCAPSPR